jgi:hypothetical protein
MDRAAFFDRDSSRLAADHRGDIGWCASFTSAGKLRRAELAEPPSNCFDDRVISLKSLARDDGTRFACRSCIANEVQRADIDDDFLL